MSGRKKVSVHVKLSRNDWTAFLLGSKKVNFARFVKIFRKMREIFGIARKNDF
jgi:hypothetical protein